MWASNPGFKTSLSGEEYDQCFDLYCTCRENILFGQTEDNKMYNQVRKNVILLSSAWSPGFGMFCSCSWSRPSSCRGQDSDRRTGGECLQTSSMKILHIKFNLSVYLRISVNTDLPKYHCTKVNLSGGQKQRVALARAAYSQPEVFPPSQCKQARKPWSYASFENLTDQLSDWRV